MKPKFEMAIAALRAGHHGKPHDRATGLSDEDKNDQVRHLEFPTGSYWEPNTEKHYMGYGSQTQAPPPWDYEEPDNDPFYQKMETDYPVPPEEALNGRYHRGWSPDPQLQKRPIPMSEFDQSDLPIEKRYPRSPPGAYPPPDDDASTDEDLGVLGPKAQQMMQEYRRQNPGKDPMDDEEFMKSVWKAAEEDDTQPDY